MYLQYLSLFSVDVLILIDFAILDDLLPKRSNINAALLTNTIVHSLE